MDFSGTQSLITTEFGIDSCDESLSAVFVEREYAASVFYLLPLSCRLSFSASQVDLETPTQVTGIITQGAKDFGNVQYVSEFKVAYSDDGKSWTVLKDKSRSDKVSKPKRACGIRLLFLSSLFVLSVSSVTRKR